MRKILLLAIALTLCFASGCEDIADVSVDVKETEAFPVIGGSGVYGVNIDLTDNNDYGEYDSYIKAIEIKRLDFRVARNEGSSGSFTLYIQPLDPDLDFATVTAIPAEAVQVTDVVTFDKGITTEAWANIPLVNKKYFENLFLKQRRFTLWADITSSGVSAVEIVMKFNIEITASILEKL